MKKILIIIGLTGLMWIMHTSVNAQCNTDGYVENCMGSMADGFTFLKSYKVDGVGGQKDKVEFSYVFSKDTQYFINICTGGENTDGIKMTLLDSNRKMVGTNFMNGKFFPAITFPCATTGIYYISFTFENSSAHCGGSVLGFKR
ncbi:MAG: hypothetical protein ACNS62_09125 [Candidatus Cyclobacteriaceae bacterium M3_2C_046]